MNSPSDSDQQQHQAAKQNIIGSLCIVIGQLLFATNDAIVKMSNSKETQLLTGRFTVQLILALIWWNYRSINNLNTNNNNNQVDNIKMNWYGDKPYIINIWLRGIFFSIEVITVWYAAIRLPLGDETCIFYQSPLWIVLIAYLWLKEKLPEWYILYPTIIMTTSGIILISQPQVLLNTIYSNNNTETLNSDGLISVFVAMFCWSMSCVLIRKAKKSHFLQLEIVSAGQTLFISIPLLILINHYVLQNEIFGDIFDKTDLYQWEFDISSMFIMIIVGFIGFGGLSLSVIGYQLGDATKVSWLEYIMVFITFIYQTIWFNDIPNQYEIIGAILITVACLLPVLSELYIYYKTKNNIKYNALQTVSETETETDDDRNF